MSTPEEDKARRTARAIASDIKLYNQKKLTAGGDIRKLLSSEITEGLNLYNQKVDPKVRALGRFFEEAIDQVLCGAPPPAPKAPPPPPAAPDDADDRQVFQQVIESRQRCGESVRGQDFTQFSRMLGQARQQLVAKYGCTSVKFQVYVKDGKTAVKPVPIGGRVPGR